MGRYDWRVIEVQRVDYIRVPVTDMEQANHFYGEVLGLERNPDPDGNAILLHHRYKPYDD
jgi:catechol 2,3-dioxygenase-like lactoylglutathione lyase family enzyme